MKDFDFEAFMARALRNELEAQRPRQCSETISGYHDTTDRLGKCCLCRKKITKGDRQPDPDLKHKSNLVLAYEYFYDPNYGDSVYDLY